MNENENWIERLKRRPSDLKLLSKEQQTEELCEVAVRKNPTMFKYALKPTKELCEFAIKRKGENLKYIPVDERTLHWCELAIKQNGLALEFVPEKYRTPEILQQAVEQDGYDLRCIQKQFRTKALGDLAFKQNPKSLHYHPCPTQEQLEQVVLIAPEVIFQQLPFLTMPILLKALQQKPSLWKTLKNLHCHLIDKMNEREWLALVRLGIEIPFSKLEQYEMNDEFIWAGFTNIPLRTGLLVEGDVQINNLYYFQLFNRILVWDEVYLQFDAEIEKQIKEMKQTDDVKQYLTDFKQQCLVMSQFRKQLKEANETSIAAFNSSVLSDFSTCFEVVQRFGLELAFIPPKYRNYRLCRLAVHQDSRARLFSPYEI